MTLHYITTWKVQKSVLFDPKFNDLGSSQMEAKISH